MLALMFVYFVYVGLLFYNFFIVFHTAFLGIFLSVETLCLNLDTLSVLWFDACTIINFQTTFLSLVQYILLVVQVSMSSCIEDL